MFERTPRRLGSAVATARWLATPPEGSSLAGNELATLALTYFSVGVAGAVVLVEAGSSPWIVLIAAVLINAITTPLAYVAAIDAGSGPVGAVAAGWLVATRFGLLGTAIGPRLWPSGWRRSLAAYGIFDPNTALAAREEDDGRCRAVYVRATLFLVVPWFVGAAVGVLAAGRLGDPQRIGLDVVLPALLLAIMWPQLRTTTGAAIATVAAVAALALVGVAPGGVPVIAAAGAALLALLGRRTTEEADA